MPYLGQQRVLLPGVQSSDLTTGKVKSGRGKDALAEGAFDTLAVVAVPSGGIASVTFDGIPSGYEHLQIRALVRGNRTPVTYDNFSLRFNNDLANNYAAHVFYGDGRSSAVNAESSTSANAIVAAQIPGSASLTNSFGVAIIDVLDYSSSIKNTTIRSLNGYESNTTGYGSIYSSICLISGGWYSTAPVTSITLVPSNSPFQEFSHFALYGVK